MRKLYNKNDNDTNGGQVVLDPVSMTFVVDDSPQPDPQPDNSQHPQPNTQHPQPDNADLARRYRLAALTILDPDYKKYLLDKAAEYEAAAMHQGHDGPAGIGGAGDPGPAQNSTSETANDLTTGDNSNGPPIAVKSTPEAVYIPAIIKAPWKLNSAVLGKNEADLDQAYGLWLAIRKDRQDNGVTWLYQKDIIETLTRRTGKTGRTIKRWLRAGENIFWLKGWKSGRRTISLIGKNRVLAHFNLTGQPGRAMAIPAEDLLGSLQQLRAALYGSWVSKTAKWGSRETIEKITSTTPRTQLNYENLAGMGKQKVFAHWSWYDVEADKQREVLQLPNIYHAVYEPYYGKHKLTRRNLQTTGYNASKNPLSGDVVKVGVEGRVLFDNANSAAEKAYRLQNKDVDGVLFTKLGETKKGNILVKPMVIALAKPAYSKEESLTQKA